MLAWAEPGRGEGTGMGGGYISELSVPTGLVPGLGGTRRSQGCAWQHEDKASVCRKDRGQTHRHVAGNDLECHKSVLLKPKAA